MVSRGPFRAVTFIFEYFGLSRVRTRGGKFITIRAKGVCACVLAKVNALQACLRASQRSCVHAYGYSGAHELLLPSPPGWLGWVVLLRNTVMSVTVVFACTIMHEDYANKVRRKSGQKMVQVRLR